MGCALKCTWKANPFRLQASIPASAASHAPGTPRKRLCFWGSSESMLMPMPITPISTRCFAIRSLIDILGPEHHHEPEFHGVARDIEDVRTDERFAARDHEETALIDLGNLIDECIAFFGREFVVSAGGLRRRVEIAMVALKIAALCEVEGDEIGFEVVDGSAIVRRRNYR